LSIGFFFALAVSLFHLGAWFSYRAHNPGHNKASEDVREADGEHRSAKRQADNLQNEVLHLDVVLAELDLESRTKIKVSFSMAVSVQENVQRLCYQYRGWLVRFTGDTQLPTRLGTYPSARIPGGLVRMARWAERNGKP
jgi:hypothetical protein